MNSHEIKKIGDDLLNLGIKKGDRIFVHSAFKGLGIKESTPEELITLLQELVGSDGTIGMPVFTYSFSPENAFSASSPSKTGVITETFRKMDGVFRSSSPSHSCAFWGKGAEYFAHSKFDIRPYSINGPFGKMVEAGFKVLFLGCGMACNSTLHAIEDWVELPYVRNGFQNCFRTEYGSKGKLYSHMPIGHRDFYQENSKVYSLLKDKGLVISGAVAGGVAQVISMREMVDVCMAELDKNPDLFLCDEPECTSCSANRYDLNSWKKAGATGWKSVWLGCHKTDVTQGVGTLSNQGWGAGVPAEGVKTNLYARAFVFKQQHEYYAVVSLETVRNNRSEQLRQAIYEKTNIPTENILVSCTHTHTGPAVGRDTFGKGNAIVDDAYLGFMFAKVAGAVYEAKHKLQPVNISYKNMEVDIGNINRNVKMEDGSYKYFVNTPGFPQPNEPISKKFSMYFFKDKNNKTIAGFGHYACHPIFGPLNSRKICGDYPGYFSDTCERELGEGAVVCFLQGALGNQMPYYYNSTFKNAEDAGKKLAYNFLASSYDEKSESLTNIEIRKKQYRPQKTTTDYAVELGALILNEKYRFGYGGGELFYQLTNRFEENVNDHNAVWVGLTNDMMYLPAQEVFPSETYEVKISKEVMGNKPGIAEEIVDACSELFQ